MTEEVEVRSLPMPARTRALQIVETIPDPILRKMCETSLGMNASLDQMVLSFHRLYDLPVVRPHEANIDFSHISKPRLAMRFGLIVEEMRELFDAMDIKCDMHFHYMDEDGKYVEAEPDLVVDFNNQDDKHIETIHSRRLLRVMHETDERDLAGVADATFDLKYVIIGFELEVGIDSKMCALEGHASNLSKLGEDGKPIYRSDGKVLKGPNFFAPDMRKPLGASGIRF